MSKLSYRLLIILLSIIVYIVTVFPRGGYFSFLGISGFPLSILLGTIVYYIFIALLLSSKRGKQNKIFLLIAVIAPFVPEFIIRIFDWSETLVSFPDNLFKLIAILTSWIVFGYTKNTLIHIGVSVIVFAVTVWFSFCGYAYWSNYIIDGSFTGKKYQHISSEIKVQDVNGEYVDLESLYKSYILLDFWSRTCGVCYKMMPEVEALYERFKNREDIEVYSVFCRYEDDQYNSGDSIVRSHGYNFPVVSIDYNANVVLMKELRVEKYPQFIIMDSDNNIVYQGTLTLAEKFLEDL